MSYSTYVSGLSRPMGIAIDNNDNLYIANSLDNNIIKVDKQGNKTIFASGFNFPENVVFDNIGFPNGYLYVMDSTTSIYKLNFAGVKTTFTTNISNHYFGMTFDSNNNLYFSRMNNNRIFKINTAGVRTLFIENSTNLSAPVGLAFNSENLYIANTQNQYVVKYDSNGTLLNPQFITITINGQPGNSFNLIFDKNNNLYLVNASSQVLIKYDDNTVTGTIIFEQNEQTIFGMAFDSAQNLYFTSGGGTAGNGIIIKYSELSPIACFKEDSKILTDKGYIPIQDLRIGDLIKTLKHDYKPIAAIGKKEMQHPALQDRIKDQLYKCGQEDYPEIFEDLIITGCHSILVDDFINEEQKNKVLEVHNEKLYGTDNKYRLPACVDQRASVYDKPGNYTIYHLALENDDYFMNYGIYANGLLVETCSKRYLKEFSNMTLIE